MNTVSEHFRAGYVALIGEPNVGKSTLLNAVLQQKISIVTSKPQTTRHKILGILSTAELQMIFLDTPGIIAPSYLLQEVMMQNADAAMNDADIVVMLVDAEKARRKAYEANNEAIAKIRSVNKTTFLVVNKIDLVRKEDILPLLAELKTTFPFDEIIPLSAATGFNVPELISTLQKYLPVHQPYYDTEIVSDAQERFFVSEIIREKVFEQFSEEIPYSTTVQIVDFKERKSKKHYISANSCGRV